MSYQLFTGPMLGKPLPLGDPTGRARVAPLLHPRDETFLFYPVALSAPEFLLYLSPMFPLDAKVPAEYFDKLCAFHRVRLRELLASRWATPSGKSATPYPRYLEAGLAGSGRIGPIPPNRSGSWGIRFPDPPIRSESTARRWRRRRLPTTICYTISFNWLYAIRLITHDVLILIHCGAESQAIPHLHPDRRACPFLGWDLPSDF